MVYQETVRNKNDQKDVSKNKKAEKVFKRIEIRTKNAMKMRSYMEELGLNGEATTPSIEDSSDESNDEKEQMKAEALQNFLKAINKQNIRIADEAEVNQQSNRRKQNICVMKRSSTIDQTEVSKRLNRVRLEMKKLILKKKLEQKP